MHRSSRQSVPPRVRLANDERRVRLLSMGIRVFAKTPYDVVSIDEIAKEANISKGLLYHYFRTKRDFYLACITMAATQLLDLLEIPPDVPPDQRLAQGIERFFAFADEHDQALLTLLSGGVGADAEVFSIIEASKQELLERIVRGLPTDGPSLRLQYLLKGWIGFVETITVEWLRSRKLSRNELQQLCFSAFVALIQSEGAYQAPGSAAS